MTFPASPKASTRSTPKRARAMACIGVLGELAALFERRKRQLAESVGLSIQQWSTLEVIQTEHFMPSLFAQEQDRTPAAVSKILRQLGEKNLISTSVSREDGRQRNYLVTRKGHGVLDALRRAREQAIDEVWMELTQEELDQFEALGSKVAGKLRQIAQKETNQESE